MQEACEIRVSVHPKENRLQRNGHSTKNDDFSKIVAEHQNMVLNTCFRFVMNKEDAEDISQEVFIEAYRSLDSFRQESKLSTWLYRIAVTKSLDHLRKKKRKKRFSSLKRVIGINDPAEELPMPSNETPAEVLSGNERVEVLQRALDALPDNQKTAFLLSKYDGYSNQEIAEIMQTSVSAIESLVHRAKKNLQKQLEKYYNGKLS
ncbi:RNA polymerase subunit sigma-24 [Prosthecochloris sp. GSB1]|uniref:RNA polymerase sigma factor n=1 Tax=Prosthecochloris sp. GSB1 TaxID=281093 RepID=UPI000B8C833B|nr:RNA polymerase sigma factor [Prosthecochloris sp. GSB1]ASQ89900.1 RNA polymerase subunit sigma-24 [Prosthecochloris sp. GSB1]